MNIAYITARIDTIANLPICELDKRQPMLVALLADLVDTETCDGELTELNECLEGQVWWNTLNELLTDAGFERLGNGHFSAAYKHRLLPRKVIKVGFKKEDSGAAYTAFCRMHQGRAGIPNIYDVQRHAGCYTVVLDELVEADTYDNDTHDHYADIARDIIEYGAELAYEADDSEFVETCKLIREFFAGIASFDMHSGNIMFDEHDTPFITDPVSFSQKKSDKPFSLEPEELLQEIEVVLAERAIERVQERKLRHEMRKDFRKARRANRKRRIAARKWQNAKMFEWRQAERIKVRNEQRAKNWLGTQHWQNVWCRMQNVDFAKLEERVAAHWVAQDHLAIQAGGALNIDKQLDAMFQG